MNRIHLAIALILALCAASARGQAPVRVLVGFPPGGGADNLARIFSEELSKASGRPFVVENRTGATGRIAIAAVKNSAPDGATLLVTSNNPLTLAPHTLRSVPYDSLEDFSPIAHLGAFTAAFAVNSIVPAKNLSEWTGLARSDPKHAVVGTAGPILVYILSQEIGVPLQEVMYRGMGPLTGDLLGGHVRSALLSLDTLVPQVKTGKVRILAQASAKRSVYAPDIPTFTELGYPGMEVISGWFALLGPSGVSAELIARYNSIVVQAMRRPDVRDRLKSLYIEHVEMSPEELASKLKSEFERRKAIVKASGFVPE